jgi:hypothetical protein
VRLDARLLVVAAVAVVVTLIVVLWLVWAPWSDHARPPARATVPSLMTFGTEWTAPDGDHLRIGITPAQHATTAAAPGGCLAAAGAGHLNVPFAVRIDNLGRKAAPVPEIEIAANTGADGAVRPAELSLAHGSRRIELDPRAAAGSCSDAAALGPVGRAGLPAHGSLTLQGLVGGVVAGTTGTASGLSLIVRYHQQDASAPGGASVQEFVVPFALRR